MLIEEQIKNLQRIKAKIDLYKKVASNVQDELASVNQDEEHKALEREFPGLLAEFCQEIGAFCSKRVEQLGNGGSVPRAVELPPPEAQQPVKDEARPILPPDSTEEEPTDPLRFLLKYKHLDGKTVAWTTKDGQVQGKVRGLLAPNIIVETDTGHTVKVAGKILKVVS
jgi:hypothetical protein